MDTHTDTCVKSPAMCAGFPVPGTLPLWATADLSHTPTQIPNMDTHTDTCVTSPAMCAGFPVLGALPLWAAADLSHIPTHV